MSMLFYAAFICMSTNRSVVLLHRRSRSPQSNSLHNTSPGYCAGRQASKQDRQPPKRGLAHSGTHPVGDVRPFVKSPLPPSLLLLSPILAAGAGGGAAERAKEDDEPADITAPIPKISRGFFASPEPLRLAVRDAAPVPAPVAVEAFVSFRDKQKRGNNIGIDASFTQPENTAVFFSPVFAQEETKKNENIYRMKLNTNGHATAVYLCLLQRLALVVGGV